ncbi:MAG: response regulator [Chitinispirillales bacterium]|jgi:PleD family two-component response regulator|nr:response regulator [Chitinispirillales bacterium]
MRLSTEQLRSIGALKLSGRLDGLDDDAYDGYCETLVEFVEDFPEVEASLKKAMFIGDKETVALILSGLAETLAGIYADDLAQECEKARGGVDDAGPEQLEADLTAFITAVATLSVDIQMECHKVAAAGGEPVRPKTRKYPVLYTDKQKNVLAVDDIPATLNLLKSVLVKAGYNFSGVNSAEAALKYASMYTPDLFILDIEMPKMDGFELAARLREAGHNAPIIFLTGNTTREYLIRAIKAGAADFIVKPVNIDTVTAKIKKIFEPDPVY